mmetsp:Transcript_3937/g.7843  ORF Transcript_3937/g.7843 Transcript_3937/m.7843 type:complete len:178 (+) Transcript_3937:61-594(+)
MKNRLQIGVSHLVITIVAGTAFLPDRGSYNTWCGTPTHLETSLRNNETGQETPRYMTRIFSGDDGHSHFEKVLLDMTPFSDTEGAHGQATSMLACQGIQFRTSPPGYSLDWHNAPRRQYVIQIQGVVEIEVGNGERATLGPGEILLAEDLIGFGHRTKVIGEQQRFYAILPIENDST